MSKEFEFSRRDFVKKSSLGGLSLLALPTLTSMGLSAASLLTGVFVVEIIFGINGISEVITKATSGIPDAPAALGFAVYSVIIVLVLMFILDVVQAIMDPRVRSEVLGL